MIPNGEIVMINASIVKELREKTGCGMMDCKKALTSCNGDIEAATEWLRKQGLSNASKKADRDTAEGLIAIFIKDEAAAIIELNSETDFVGKNEQFIKLAENLAESALNSNIENVEDLKNSNINGTNVTDLISKNIAVIGENIQLKRLGKLQVENGVVASYIHNSVSPNTGKIGVIIALESNGDRIKLHNLGKQLAMHVAAVKPHSLTIDELDKGLITKEREIFAEQAKKSDKPEAVIEKMIEGRIRKFYEEVVLLEQIFVLDGKTKISQLLEESSKTIGAPVKLKSFIRFALGEDKEQL